MNIFSEDNSHYFYVMGWISDDKINAPKYKKQFDIYKDSKNYFLKLLNICKYVEMFENIGGKRKWIADSTDYSHL